MAYPNSEGLAVFVVFDLLSGFMAFLTDHFEIILGNAWVFIFFTFMLANESRHTFYLFCLYFEGECS